MQRNTPWQEHLSVLTAWGKASATTQTPPPTDAQLWAVTRTRDDLDLPEQIDPGLLAHLRAAFDRGRQPHIDLAALANALREHGHDVVIEQTGGGVVVLYAGRQAQDRYGDPRWSAAVGPGWYENGDLRHPVADPVDCYIGPDGDDTWAVTVPVNWTLDTLVELTAAVIDEVEAQRARFVQAAATARDALWAAFAAQYPEVVTGDLAPGADRAFVAESNKLLAGWLEDNRSRGHEPPAHVAALAGHTVIEEAPVAGRPAGAAGPE